MSREEELFRSFKDHPTRDSLADLLRGYQDHVYNICFQVLRHPEDAEDVSQDVLLQATRGVVKAECARQFKVWVYRVAIHSSLDLNRARMRRIELARRAADLRPKEVVLVKPEERAALMEAIESLDDKTQCLLIEHYFDKLTLDEIGQREGISSVAVWKRLDRAKGLLRRALIAAGFSSTPAGLAHGLESIAPAAAPGDLIGKVVISNAAIAAVGGAVVATKSALAAGTLAAAALIFGAAVLGGLYVRSHRTPEVVQKPAQAASATGEIALPAEPVVAGPRAAIRGRVIDGNTMQPIPGVAVQFFAARRARMTQANYLAWRAPYAVGEGITSREHATRLLETPGGRVPDAGPLVEVYDRPDPDSQPLHEAVTGNDGWFSAESSLSQGILKVSHSGYMSRHVPFGVWKEEPVIRLFPGHVLSGRVVPLEGHPVPPPLGLAFFGVVYPTRQISGESHSGSWESESKDDGTFQVEIGTPVVVPRVVTTGWAIEWPVRPIDIRTGGPFEIVVRRVPILKVMDAITRRPIERFRVMVEKAGGIGLWQSGEFYATNGEMVIFTFSGSLKRLEGGDYRIRVWADGTRVWDSVIPNLLKVPVVEALLEKGEPPTLRGIVRRGGSPVARAEVRLLTGQYRANPWSSLGSLLETFSDETGAFQITAPEGEYVMQVLHDSSDYCALARLPSSQVIVDLAGLCEVVVTVKDPTGAPIKDKNAVLHSIDVNREWAQKTDSEGVATFRNVPAGMVNVGPGPWKKVELAPGQTTRIDITLEEIVDQPTRGLLKVTGVPDLEGWKIHLFSSKVTDRDLVPGPGGEFDLPSQRTYFMVVSPWGDEWHFMNGSGVMGNRVADIDLDGPEYEGVLKDQATGAPLAAVDITASTGKGDQMYVETKSDSMGKFRIRGLKAIAYELRFHKEGLGQFQFRPNALPAINSKPLEIRFPKTATFGTREVAGRATRASTGGPPAVMCVYLLAALEAPGGLLLFVAGSTFTDPDGNYKMNVAGSQRYDVLIWTDYGRPEMKLQPRFEWRTASPSGPATLNLTAP